MKTDAHKLLIVIPAYNEEESIGAVVDKLNERFPQYDYVVVNDGSKDRTEQICRQRGYSLISLPINLGLAGAFQAGLKYADQKGYDSVIQLDADGQHLPEYIAPMLEKMQQGYDIVIGSRFVDEPKPKTLRMLGSRLISWAIRLTTGVRIQDPTSGMRLYSRAMIREFANGVNYGPEPDTVSFLLRQGIRVGEVQVKMEDRMAGTSYLNWARSMFYMLKMLVSILFLQSFRRRDQAKMRMEKSARGGKNS